MGSQRRMWWRSHQRYRSPKTWHNNNNKTIITITISIAITITTSEVEITKNLTQLYNATFLLLAITHLNFICQATKNLTQLHNDVVDIVENHPFNFYMPKATHISDTTTQCDVFIVGNCPFNSTSRANPHQRRWHLPFNLLCPKLPI